MASSQNNIGNYFTLYLTNTYTNKLEKKKIEEEEKVGKNFYNFKYVYVMVYYTYKKSIAIKEKFMVELVLL